MVWDLSRSVPGVFRSPGNPLINLFHLSFNSKYHFLKNVFIDFDIHCLIELPIVLPIVLPIELPIVSPIVLPIEQHDSGPRGRGRDPLGQGPGPGPLGPGAWGPLGPWAQDVGYTWRQ